MREIWLVDLAAEARKAYGEQANEIVGRELPEHDWRFEMIRSDGSRVTFAAGATAEYVATYDA